METVSSESKEVRLYKRIAEKPELWSPICALVQRLKEQGVLEMFIRCDKVEELNALLSAKVNQFKAFVTSDTYNAAFEPILLQNAVSKIYDTKQDDVSDDEIKAEIQKFVDNPNWAKIFETLWGQAHMIMKFGYRSQVQTYRRMPGMVEENLSQVETLFSEAFPITSELPLPKSQWIREKQHLFNVFNLYDILTDEYEDTVVGNIQHMSQKPVKADVKEAIDIVATDFTERYLFGEVLRRDDVDEEHVTPIEMHRYMETMKKERPLYIMVIYYIFAHKSFSWLNARK